MKKAVYPSLEGKRVLVTGGGSGIGASLVEGFARQGARVWFVDIAEADSLALVEQLAQRADVRHAPVFRRCDLTDSASLQSVLGEVIAQAGSIDVLINNAANDDRHQLENVTPAYWDQRINVNLRHLLFCAQAVVPGMRAAGGGVILNFGSISWHLALPDLVVYETAKAGIEGMTRALARDLGKDKIRVNCVVPGGIRTPRQMALWQTPESEALMLEHQCLKERVDPEHVTAMALFLSSDDARMCTAHNYFVDAGWR